MTPPARSAALLTAVLVKALLSGAAWAADPAPRSSPSVSGQVPARIAPARVPQAVPVEAKPVWGELTALQKQALAPLSSTWSSLSEAHKRKWVAVSGNFPTMPPGEQARLHTRMAEWAALSPQQRAQARLNFAETQRLPDDDRKAKWEAYQALPEAEKRKLAAGATPVAPPTAAAVQPVPPQKLARVPKAAKDDNRAPRIAVVPDQPMDADSFTPRPAPVQR